MAEQQRDKSVERWLRQTPAAGVRSESACLDAETLAAWAEGLLHGPERAAAEAHASGCARCQAMLAVMVRTMPGPPPTPGSPLRKWLTMLTPALAAGAAVALWFAVDSRPLPAPADSLTVGSTGRQSAGRKARDRRTAPAPAAGEKDASGGRSLDRGAAKAGRALERSAGIQVARGRGQGEQAARRARRQRQEPGERHARESPDRE